MEIAQLSKTTCGPEKILKVKVTAAWSKVKSRSYHDVAQLHSPTNRDQLHPVDNASVVFAACGGMSSCSFAFLVKRVCATRAQETRVFLDSGIEVQ